MGKTGTRIVIMKNKATLHGEIECNNLGESGNGAVGQRRCCFKLGLDVELRNVAVAIQCEQSGWRRSYLCSN